jgi:hypothetical protein
MALALKRECSHCGVEISVTAAISMVQGTGVEPWTKVQIGDGRIVPPRMVDVNPQTMRNHRELILSHVG